MDAGAVFFGVRDLHEGLQLNYPALTSLLVEKRGFDPPAAGNGSQWVLWTSVVSQNTGQVRFLQYAERELGWRVRRFHPAEGYMIEPASLGLAGDARANRLLRFDASISSAIGQLGRDHRIAIITDSFAVAEPLVRAARSSGARNLIAFFGRLLDSRWQRLLRSAEAPLIDFLDLDEFEQDLFGSKRAVEQTAWTDDFLVK